MIYFVKILVLRFILFLILIFFKDVILSVWGMSVMLNWLLIMLIIVRLMLLMVIEFFGVKCVVNGKGNWNYSVDYFLLFCCLIKCFM